jgi:HEAT repeat protein
LDKEDGKQKLAFLIILLLTGAGALAWVYWPREKRANTPEQLAEQALAGDNPIVQQRAATQLSGYRHAEAAPPLRQVLKEARHPDVRAAAAQGLGDVQDFQSVPELLRLCDDPSPLVRGRAGAAVTNIIGMDFFFNANDPPEKRKAVIESMRRAYEQMRRFPPPEYRNQMR